MYNCTVDNIDRQKNGETNLILQVAERLIGFPVILYRSGQFFIVTNGLKFTVP